MCKCGNKVTEIIMVGEHVRQIKCNLCGKCWIEPVIRRCHSDTKGAK